MLLAAGLGTRLRPLTDHTPKPLVPVGGVPILERIARRLVAAGADRLIVNTSHLGEQVQAYVREHDGFGAEYAFSPEPGGPLETGGGLLHAAALFRGDAPFLLHNADILTAIPLADLYAAHLSAAPLATVAVMERPTSRHLLFDDVGLLGRSDARTGLEIRVREPVGAVRKLAFAGVHVISPAIFGHITERGAFSILDPYLRLAGEGERILPFRADGHLWLDIGSHAQLAEGNRLAAAGALD
ncbi:MAG: Nucleotidyl transferase [Gemmatimonadetes bacterium]|nr:Nucleotidyl transferase [Gemmatimonadota bacterium]